VRIGGGPRAAGRARDELSRLAADLHGPVIERLRLLVTELVTNSVRHAGAATVDLSVLVGPSRVRVEIANRGGPFTPQVGTAGRESESGWGLFLVDRLSEVWGVVDDPGYQRIWFELSRT
jgi:anti-sigma regulatory factor (Ser/Thr protein kinase)